VEDEENSDRPRLYESKRLAKAMLSYLARKHHLIGELFDLLDIFTVRTRVDFAFLQDYLKTTVSDTYTVEEKQQACSLDRLHSPM
jgi:transformation/transcription domain-associated protein